MVFILPTLLRYLLAPVYNHCQEDGARQRDSVPRARKADISPAQVGAGGVKELHD